MPPQVPILNIAVDNVRFHDFVESLQQGAVFTPNMDHLLKLQRDRAFYQAYDRAEHVVCDSRIVQWMSRLLHPGKGIAETIPGSDLLPAYCRHLADTDETAKVYLLGGTVESVVEARRALNAKCSREVVTGAYSPPFGFEDDSIETNRIIDAINQHGATVLAIGVGAPKQELWLHQHRDRMPHVQVFLAVGASIEFESGRMRRAPGWMNRAGLEWLFRLAQEPRRLFRRYLIEGPQTVALILKQRFGHYQNPWD